VDCTWSGFTYPSNSEWKEVCGRADTVSIDSFLQEFITLTQVDENEMTYSIYPTLASQMGFHVGLLSMSIGGVDTKYQ
jgi:hypothetical protein